jgi:transposase
MKKRVKHYTDEFKFEVVQEYLQTAQSAQDILRKYHLGGNSNITSWMRKFGIEPPSDQQIATQQTMAKQVEKTRYEKELEAKVQKLQQELEHEQLRTLALNTLIDVAERDLKISIRKKAGAKR